MKIPAIQQICYRQYYQKKVDKNLQTQPYVFERKNIELSNNPTVNELKAIILKSIHMHHRFQ